MDVFGKCGNKKCGEVRNIEHKYSPGEDPCFNMVNKKYRLVSRSAAFIYNFSFSGFT